MDEDQPDLRVDQALGDYDSLSVSSILLHTRTTDHAISLFSFPDYSIAGRQRDRYARRLALGT